MSRVLLLCFVHGFKGNDDTFRDFPEDLKIKVTNELPGNHVEVAIYPKYQTRGQLTEAVEPFVQWLKERVIELRKAHFDEPWPPNDRRVGVVLVAHSMGGFVAADGLFLALSLRNPPDADPFPLIQGLLTFDTPYNGLARSMFVYGAFSNYSKVNGVFNAMTALSAAAPAAIARLGARTAAPSPNLKSNPAAWATWQLIAVRTGTVGAIAAGGVAAYTHREAILSGVKSIKNINRESIVQGYNSTISTIGQGLAYINRGNVGRSFAWLSEHFTFVGALLKQKELARRLDRLAALSGIGVHDFYLSLGENGYWSGGYFVPERTFCAVPEQGQDAARLFERMVMNGQDDEIKAHLNIFNPEKHKEYKTVVERSANLIQDWFLSEQVVYDAGFPLEDANDERDDGRLMTEALEKAEVIATAVEGTEEVKDAQEQLELLPDESPIDIAAAAVLVPVKNNGQGPTEETITEDEGTKETVAGDETLEKVSDAAEETSLEATQKRTYLQHLFQIAQQAGTEVKGWKIPGSFPTSITVPDVSIPGVKLLPRVGSAMSSLGQVSIRGAGYFKRKREPESAEEIDEIRGSDGTANRAKAKGNTASSLGESDVA